MRRANISLVIFFLLIVFSVVVSPTPAYAGVFDDILNGVKNTVQGGVDKVSDLFNGNAPRKELTIESKIELAPEGDINKNGQIEAGDIVRFTYVITNTTDKDHSLGTLKTNINRKQLNFIHNVTGTVSLNDDDKTITIPNFNIAANQVITITFDARLNYNTVEDPSIATEAEFIDTDKKSVAKSLRKEIRAKRILKDKIPGMTKQQFKKERTQ